MYKAVDRHHLDDGDIVYDKAYNNSYEKLESIQDMCPLF